MTGSRMSRMAMMGWVLIVVWCVAWLIGLVRVWPEGVSLLLGPLIISLMGLLMGYLIVRLLRALRGSDLRWGWTLGIILVSAAAVGVVIEGLWNLTSPIIWAVHLTINLNPAAGIAMVYHGARRPRGRDAGRTHF